MMLQRDKQLSVKYFLLAENGIYVQSCALETVGLRENN